MKQMVKNISSICYDPYDIMYLSLCLSVLNINALLDEIYILRLLEYYYMYNSTYNKYICNKHQAPSHHHRAGWADLYCQSGQSNIHSGNLGFSQYRDYLIQYRAKSELLYFGLTGPNKHTYTSVFYYSIVCTYLYRQVIWLTHFYDMSVELEKQSRLYKCYPQLKQQLPKLLLLKFFLNKGLQALHYLGIFTN